MEQHGELNEQLVEVFDTKQESEAIVIGGLLESAGIECSVISREAPQDVLPGVGGTVVLVREEQAEEARQIIQDSRAHPTTDADATAANISDTTDHPPAV